MNRLFCLKIPEKNWFMILGSQNRLSIKHYSIHYILETNQSDLYSVVPNQTFWLQRHRGLGDVARPLRVRRVCDRAGPHQGVRRRPGVHSWRRDGGDGQKGRFQVRRGDRGDDVPVLRQQHRGHHRQTRWGQGHQGKCQVANNCLRTRLGICTLIVYSNRTDP